jgi:phage/plasmid-associated DNA primase
LESVIGPHNIAQVRVPQLNERFETAAFVGKTVLSGKDVPGDFLNNDAAHVIKALIGGDQMDAELKHARERMPIKGEFNMVITSNCRLHVRLDSDAAAWRRRLLILDFENVPTAKPIADFAGILVREEGPGILNWMVEGALLLLRELAANGRPTLTSAQTKRIEDLLCESDSVREFVRRSTAKTPGSNVTIAELQEAYLDFCDNLGWTPVKAPLFQTTIRNVVMEEHRAAFRTDIKRNEKNQRGFSGISVALATQSDSEAA